jgi:hypothetical protein
MGGVNGVVSLFILLPFAFQCSVTVLY